MTNQVSFKPCHNIRLYFAVYTALLFTIILEIVGVIVLLINHELHDFIMGQYLVIGIYGVCLLGYIIAELSYNRKYVITADEIIKYKSKKMVFKISKEEIIGLYYRKPTVAMRIFFLLGVIMGDPCVGVLSIRFRNAEIEPQINIHSWEKLETLTDEEKLTGIKESVELVGKRELKRLCEILGKNVTYL